MRKIGLTNNQLKVIAMVTMTVDHVGFLLFPRLLLLRYIGRLAFPIYAYMVAEGCSHTKSLPKYLGSMAIMALLCQLVAFVAQQTLQQCILVTFTLSIVLIMLLKLAREKPSAAMWTLFAAAVAGVFIITQMLPQWLPNTDFMVDYDFLGVMLPVCVYAAKDKRAKLTVCAVCLALLAITGWSGQWLALMALPLLALYNGSRGTWKLKWVFYLYYPAHLAALWLLSNFI